MAEWTAPHLSSQESICHEWTKLAPDQHLLIHIGKVYEFQSMYSNATHAADSLRCFFAVHDILCAVEKLQHDLMQWEADFFAAYNLTGCKRARGGCGDLLLPQEHAKRRPGDAA